jgi:hypothetical protein
MSMSESGYSKPRCAFEKPFFQWNLTTAISMEAKTAAAPICFQVDHEAWVSGGK